MIHQSNKTASNIIAAVLAGLTIAACSESNSEDINNSDRFDTAATIPAVEAVQARYGSLPLSERLSGTVVAGNQVVLYPEISGRVSEVLIQDGEKVQEGDPLVRLESRQYSEQVQQAEAGLRIEEARLKQANARLNELEAQYKRAKILAEKGLTTDLQMETLQAQMVSAEADIDLAEAQVAQSRSTLEEQQEILSRTVIRAPITGTVGQRNIEAGMQVSSSTPLLIIGNLEHMRIEVVLTGNMLNHVETGQTARIYVGPEGPDQQAITAELSRISPFLNNITRSTEAEIDVNNKRGLLKPGMFVPVDILYGESRQATLIPISAIYTNPNSGETGVFVATSLGAEVEPAEQDDSQGPPPLTQPVDVQFKPVDVIARGRMEAGIAGIDPGTWVVTVGQNLLSVGRNQARVRTSSWERILSLQSLQPQDLLRQVLEEQNEQDQSQQPAP